VRPPSEASHTRPCLHPCSAVEGCPRSTSDPARPGCLPSDPRRSCFSLQRAMLLGLPAIPSRRSHLSPWSKAASPRKPTRRARREAVPPGSEPPAPQRLLGFPVAAGRRLGALIPRASPVARSLGSPAAVVATRTGTPRTRPRDPPVVQPRCRFCSPNGRASSPAGNCACSPRAAAASRELLSSFASEERRKALLLPSCRP
jgi:hypothetical protein